MDNADKHNQLVIEDGGQRWTTSLIVAEQFGKEHRHVLEAIDNAHCTVEFRSANFRGIQERDESDRVNKIVYMNSRAFMFAVMGFTGERAGLIKERFVNAFEDMKEQLTRPKTALEMFTLSVQVAQEHQRQMDIQARRMDLLDHKVNGFEDRTQAKLQSIEQRLVVEKINQFPDGCMTLQEICDEVFRGVTAANVSAFLKSIAHPSVEYKYTDEKGQLHMQTVYQAIGLHDARKRLVRETQVKKETAKNQICFHHAIGRYYMKKVSHVKNAMALELQ